MASSGDLAYIKKLVRKQLTEREKEFCLKHQNDSDEELLEYARQAARELGGGIFKGDSIYNYDILGSSLLKRRFGTWDNMLALAGIEKDLSNNRPIRGCLYCRETRRLHKCVEDTRTIIKQKQNEFKNRYAGREKADLLEYIKQAAADFGYTPASADLLGGSYITRRFGGWAAAVQQAGLSKCKIKYKRPEDGRLFMDELRRQLEMYDENLRLLVVGEIEDVSVIATNKMAKKMEKDAVLEEKAQALARRMLIFKEKLFAAEYAKASDKLLLTYLAGCAQEIGRLPYKSEVIGGAYLERRFGSWTEALQRAGCNEPPGAIPKPEERLIYTREVQIQKYLLEGRESVVRMLYKNPLIGRMQSGNIFHILRWNPAAANSADSQCYNLAKARFEQDGRKKSVSQAELQAEADKIRKIYNRTLESLDLQTRRFVAKYKDASKKELLKCVQQRAQQLHTTPEMLDVVGAEFIMQKLHYTWGMVLNKLRLKKNGAKHKIYQSRLFKEEFKRQKQIWEQETAGVTAAV